jgi:hypothetical protein
MCHQIGMLTARYLEDSAIELVKQRVPELVIGGGYARKR